MLTVVRIRPGVYKDMADIPSEILVTPRPNNDICIAEMRADIKYIKETLDKTVADHESRIRVVEQKKEDCQQQEKIEDLQETVDDHESRLSALESTHDQDTGAKQALMSYRELAAWGLTVLLGFITVYQSVKGAL